MGYRDPKRIINTSFDRFAEASRGLVNQIAVTNKQIQQQVKDQKEEATRREDAVEAEKDVFASRMNQIGNYPSDKLDRNVVSLWQQKKDEYFDIKQKISSGELSKQEGNVRLRQIRGLIPKFKQDAAIFGAQVTLGKDLRESGQLASTGSIQSQNVVEAIGMGGDVRTVERGGELYYFKPSFVKDDKGNDTEEEQDPSQMFDKNGLPKAEYAGSLINGKELRAMDAREEDIWQSKYDISKAQKTMYDAEVNPDDPSSEFVRTQAVTKGMTVNGVTYDNIPEGQTWQIAYTPEMNDDGTSKNADLIMQKIVNSKAMDPIMSSGKMNTYWQDSIPDGKFDPATGKFESNSIAGIAAKLNEGTSPPKFPMRDSNNQPLPFDPNNFDYANETPENQKLFDEGYDYLQNSRWHEFAEEDKELEGAIKEQQDSIAKFHIASTAVNNNGDTIGAVKILSTRKTPTPPKTTIRSTTKWEDDKAREIQKGDIKDKAIITSTSAKDLESRITGGPLTKESVIQEFEELYPGQDIRSFYDEIKDVASLQRVLREIEFGGQDAYLDYTISKGTAESPGGMTSAQYIKKYSQ